MGKSIVGLEVTEESVRAAEVGLGRTPQLLAYGEVPLAPEVSKDSEVLDSGAVAAALRQLWTGARFRSRRVVLGVASRRILVREYSTQAMRPDMLREALPYQVQDLLPVPASQAVLDFYPLSQQGDQVSGLLVAAVSETLEQIIGTLGKVKLRAAAVDLTAFGLARATATLAPAEATTATVFIGDHTTQVVIARGGVPQFVRLLPIDVPTSAAMRHLSDPAALVAEMEAALVPAAATRPRGANRGPASDPVEDLAARLRSTLAFYGGRPTAQPISAVFITGAGAAVEGIMPALGAAIDVPVIVVSATDVIAAEAPPIGELGLNLVSSIGIALGQVR
jgi:type IV pilus assembly protein PilM